MRRQVTVGGLVALALLTGSVVAFAQPPVPADCAPADTEVQRDGLVPRAQDDPDDDPTVPSDEPADDEPADEDPDGPPDEEPEPPAGAEPTDEDPAADEPEPDEPGTASPTDDDPAGDDPAGDDPAGDDPAGDDPAGDDPTGDDPAGDEPAGDDPAGDTPAGAGPADDGPGAEQPGSDDPAAGADDPSGDDPRPGVDPCAPGAADGTAAAALDWGAPTREDEFDGPLDEAWEVYTGTGFDGRGTRTADALTVQDGVLTITGDAEGATGGMAWGPGRMYGRWEARVRTPEADPSYNALLLLWPDDESGAGSEIDFMEMLDPARQTANAFLHSGGETVEPMGEVAVDATEWHNWAVEWTPTSLTAYLDGVEWWTVTDPELLPQGPMHLCVQLDWFPDGDAEVQESSMQVEWVREYAVDAPAPADDPAAGEDPAGDRAGDDPTGNDSGDAGDASADDPSDGDRGEQGDGDRGDGDRGDGDRGEGDGGDGDGADPDGGEGDAEGAALPSLREGAPDGPARPGLVTGAVATPRT